MFKLFFNFRNALFWTSNSQFIVVGKYILQNYLNMTDFYSKNQLNQLIQQMEIVSRSLIH